MPTFHFTFEPSVANAPAGFIPAVQEVGALFASLFKSTVSVNVTVGFGTLDGSPLDPNALGESSPNFQFTTWAPLSKAMLVASPGLGIPALDPTNGGNFLPFNANAKALGLLADDGVSQDGAMGFMSTPGTFNYTGSSGQGFDFLGTVAHELSELMGRVLLCQQEYGAGNPVNLITPYDLLDFKAPGVHSYLNSDPRYFSIDGGVTNLKSFNTQNGADDGDWDNGPVADACDAFGSLGAIEPFSAVDVAALKAIGWDGPSILPPNTPMTAPLICKDAAGNVGPAPIGVVSASDGSPVALSSTGQFVNYRTGTGNVTLKWHDPSGKLPDATDSLIIGNPTGSFTFAGRSNSLSRLRFGKVKP